MSIYMEFDREEVALIEEGLALLAAKQRVAYSQTREVKEEEKIKARYERIIQIVRKVRKEYDR